MMKKVKKARDILKEVQQLVTDDATNDINSEEYLSDGECVDILVNKIGETVNLLDKACMGIILDDVKKIISMKDKVNQAKARLGKAYEEAQNDDDCDIYDPSYRRLGLVLDSVVVAMNLLEEALNDGTECRKETEQGQVQENPEGLDQGEQGSESCHG